MFVFVLCTYICRDKDEKIATTKLNVLRFFLSACKLLLLCEVLLMVVTSTEYEQDVLFSFFIEEISFGPWACGPF